MHAGSAEQPAPTIHQSLIWNNSTADSSHKIAPFLSRRFLYQIMALIWSSCPAHTHHSLTCSSQAAQLYLCVCLCVHVHMLVWTSCYCFYPRWRLAGCFHGTEKLSFDKRLWQTRDWPLFIPQFLKFLRRRKSDRPRDELWIQHVQSWSLLLCQSAFQGWVIEVRC